ncbi:MAG TPA: antibiotic biosynthesis monooxygenase [Mycobacteriales bacterium]|jgi:heme-degrading monooxygenase HmoA|nr:antibiotic biosynthesis monooxygenase [Mycobacteriales bacterium]
MGAETAVVEHALLRIEAGREAEFEAAFAVARDILVAAEGAGAITMSRCVEEPSTYLLQVRWDSLEAHMVAFRNSPAFGAWRGLVGPFFAQPPQVHHFAVI